MKYPESFAGKSGPTLRFGNHKGSIDPEGGKQLHCVGRESEKSSVFEDCKCFVASLFFEENATVGRLPWYASVEERRETMAVPKRRQSNQKTRSRRAHDFLVPRQLTFCSNCGKSVPTHRICSNCGFYMGRMVIKTEA